MEKILTLASLLTALVVHGEITAFVRPILSMVKPSTSGYSSAGGAGVCGGVYFGATDSHELSAEIDYTRWDGSYVGYSTTEEYIPIMLNYRYHFTLMNAERINFYADSILPR